MIAPAHQYVPYAWMGINFKEDRARFVMISTSWIMESVLHALPSLIIVFHVLMIQHVHYAWMGSQFHQTVSAAIQVTLWMVLSAPFALLHFKTVLNAIVLERLVRLV